MEFFSSNKIYDFMGKRKIFISISIFLIILSLFSIFTKGFNWGIDFAGGVEVQVRFEKPIKIATIREVIAKKYPNANITTFGSDREFLIRLNVKDVNSDVRKSLGSEIKNILSKIGKVEIRRVDIVGAKVGNELREKGLKALIFAIIGILIYVSFRFEWRFAVASVLALFHDTIISLGAVSAFNIEVNLDVLAAILTLMGYSLNDTIVVFDRIREEVKKSNIKDLATLINVAISKTLSRTVLTSLTTFFVVLTLYLFGGEIIKPFSFTLLVGIIVGTYSSIFIASPLLIWLGFKIDDYRKKLAEKEKRKREKEKLRQTYQGGVV
ncbi:protein translocase subunit SecF [Caminibacter mediatlanticus TB-2]|uniref:Protein-export membrane protein SecF n=1 Tax=Caminibacter mediatlanticus TB-2 TaxID=391592 RepID=A0AAI9AH16_9BACT|nr:protein translocase subunit SecF [Caminibacter mediatlanticus]EDM23476.1 protein export protein SecF [Caminibacter mediatlanticus TB-2]QCT94047.1 protein translocase subunit SecF [Caminibacter mediatlanticus TB-2]